MVSSTFAQSFRVLTLDANGGTNTMPADNLIYDVGASFAITPPVRDGYTFAGWTGDGATCISHSGFEGSSAEELSFNGGTYYALPTSLKYTDAITVNLWAYMDNWGDYATSSMRMISCTATGGWGIETNTEGDIKFTMYDGTAAKYRTVTSSTLWSALSSGWHMFTLTFDGRNMYGYVDGKMHGASDIFNGRGKGTIGYNTNAILLGAEAGTGTTPDGGYFTGKIKDVSIVNAGMTSTDVSNLYSEVSSTKGDKASVVRYYVPNANRTLKATWTANTVTTPTIYSDLSTVSFETTEGVAAGSHSITVTAANLTGNISATLGGTNASAFSITPASLGTAGGTITITYKETAVGSHNATLTLSSAGATSKVVTLKGTVKAKASDPGTSGPLTADQMSVNLSGKQNQSPAPYVDVKVTCTGLTSTLSFNPSTGAVTVASLSDWNEQTGGTLRITLNTTKAVGDYSGYVAVQSGAATNRIEIQVSASITEGDVVVQGPIVADKMSVDLIGTYGSTEVVYEDVHVTATDLKSNMSVNSVTGAVVVEKLSGWSDLTGGTLRLKLNTTYTLGAGEYTGYVAIQSGTDARLEIVLGVILKDPNAVNPDDYEELEPSPTPDTPSWDFTATPTLTKVWETSKLIADKEATRYATGFGGKVYAVDKTATTLYSWDSEGCDKTQVVTGFGGGFACVADDGGNILTNKAGNATDTWQAYNIASNTVKDIAITMPSGVASGLIHANVVAVGDVLSAEGGTLYMAPHTKNVAAKIVVKNGAQDASSCAAATYSGGTFSVEYQLAAANVAYNQLGTESFIWRERSGNTNYISNGTLKTYNEPSTTTPATGFATFALNNIEYGIVPTGTDVKKYSDGFSLFTLLDGEVVASREQTGTVTGNQYGSFHVEKVSEGEVNIYYYKSGLTCGMYKFAYPTISTGGGVATDIESAAGVAFGYYTAGQTLYVTGVTAKTIHLYNIAGQKVCTVNNTNEMSLANLQGVYIISVTDANNVMHTGKIIVK